ncbi:MAG: hypothetical protein ACI91R_000416 [Vicingaceae bacterium]
MVDSIYTESYGGLVRTVYRIDRNGQCKGSKVYLIEGVGSKSSFIKPLRNCNIFGPTSLLCFTVDSVVIEINNNLTMQPPCCLLTTIGVKPSSSKKQIQFSPNPTTGFLNVKEMHTVEEI